MSAAPDTSPELVQLREAKAVSIFNDHHRCVRYVDANLDYRGCYQDIEFVVTETAHGLILLCRLHGSMQQAQAQIWKDLALQALVLGCRSLDRQRFGFLDQRADNKCLAPRRHFVDDGRVGFVAPRSRAPARDDPLAAGWQLIDYRYVQVSIERQGQRPGNWCGRHDEHMRVMPFLAQRVALLDAEAMLLIDDDQPQPAKVHIFLDQRMRADSHGGLSALDRGVACRAFALAQAPGEKNSANAEWLQHGADAACMLFGQQFRRRHDRTLVAVECGHQQGSRCNCRLARADIALQQPAHRLALRQVRADLAANAALRLCKPERQCGLKRLIGGNLRPERGPGGHGRRLALPLLRRLRGWRIDEDTREIDTEGVSLWRLVLPAAAALLHAKLDQEQLVESQAAASIDAHLLAFGIVDLRNSLGQRQEMAR